MANFEPAFKDRRDAGRQLAPRLLHLRPTNPLVLALPRGGVPVAFEVAKLLHAELHILLVRKIGAPENPELGIGTIVDSPDPQLMMNEEMLKMTGATPEYVRITAQNEFAELERRRAVYRGHDPSPDLTGCTVILVDDGIATGNTVKAALQALGSMAVRQLVLAVPVASSSSLQELEQECGEIICLHSPEPFHAVGNYYADFGQTGDNEVVGLLSEARKFAAHSHVESI